jgi:hypothetical protein
MRSLPGQRSRLRQRRVEPSCSLARRHWRWRLALSPVVPHPPSCAPFAPGPLRPFFATMGALPPARSVAPVLDLSSAASRSAPREQVSLIHALGLPTIPSPNTCECSASSGQATLPLRRVGPRLLPHEAVLNGNSGLGHWVAGSPHHTGRIEFSFLSYRRDSLRTSRSPPAALHPVSRRRSCIWLQVTLTWKGLSPLRPSALSGAPPDRPRRSPSPQGGRGFASASSGRERQAGNEKGSMRV